MRHISRGFMYFYLKSFFFGFGKEDLPSFRPSVNTQKLVNYNSTGINK
jgi:hypothetical protein